MTDIYLFKKYYLAYIRNNVRYLILNLPYIVELR